MPKNTAAVSKQGGIAVRSVLFQRPASPKISLRTKTLPFDQFQAIFTLVGTPLGECRLKPNGTAFWNVNQMTLGNFFSTMRFLIALSMPVSLSTTLPSIGNAQDFQSGLAAYDRGDYQTARKIWEPLADSGSSSAQYNLGFMYEYGLGVDQNMNLAVRWYRTASSNANSDAMFNLGAIYGNGVGIPRDMLRAYMWFYLSGELGDREAIINQNVVTGFLTQKQLEDARLMADNCKRSRYLAC